jgi:acyl-CoA thioesterase II
MNPVLQEIIDLLDVERIEKNLYRGQNHQTEHVFGGQVLAQAIASAFRTVDAPHELHSIHAYFLRAGDWNTPILYEVDRIRDGRSFSTRRVVAIQHGRAIFNMSSSWHKREDGLVHALPMPDVPPPEALRGDREAYLEIAEQRPEVKRFAFRFEAIESRQVERILMTDEGAHPPYKHTWLVRRLVVGLSTLIGLGSFEIRQDVGIPPAPQAHLLPLIVIAGMSADVDHAVDGRGAAPAAAARPPQATAIHVPLRFGMETPVVGVGVLDEFSHARGHAHHQGTVALAGLDQADGRVRISAEPVRQHTTCAAGPDDDVVELSHRVFPAGDAAPAAARRGKIPDRGRARWAQGVLAILTRVEQGPLPFTGAAGRTLGPTRI